MNIHIDLWLVYLINILPGLNGIFFLLALMSFIIGIYSREITYKDYRESIIEKITFNQKSVRFFCISVLLFILFVILPSKETATQLVITNYINQNTVIMDDEYIKSLSETIRSLLTWRK